MATSDPTPTVAVFLGAKTSAGARVWSGGLPEEPFLSRDSVYIDQLQPTIVVELVPGSVDDYLPVAYPRFRVSCYGPTKQETISLYYEMLNILHNASIGNTLSGGQRLALWHNGGPNVFTDPRTNFNCADSYFTGIAQG